MVKISGCKTDKETGEALQSALELLFMQVVFFTVEEDDDCGSNCRNSLGERVSMLLCDNIPEDLLDYLENKYGQAHFE